MRLCRKRNTYAEHVDVKVPDVSHGERERAHFVAKRNNRIEVWVVLQREQKFANHKYKETELVIVNCLNLMHTSANCGLSLARQTAIHVTAVGKYAKHCMSAIVHTVIAACFSRRLPLAPAPPFSPPLLLI